MCFFFFKKKKCAFSGRVCFLLEECVFSEECVFWKSVFWKSVCFFFFFEESVFGVFF